MALEYGYRKIMPTTEVFFPGGGLVPLAVAQKPASFQERKLHFKAKVAVENDEAWASARLNIAAGLKITQTIHVPSCVLKALLLLYF